jgi:hypothetical protein
MADAVAGGDVTGRWLFDTSPGEAGINKAKISCNKWGQSRIIG